MKRLISIILAVSMLFVLSLPAFAEGAKTDTVNNASGSKQNDVDVLIDSDGDGIPDSEEKPEDVDPKTRVYSVCVSWESLDFMYSGTWNPTLAHYEGDWMTYNGTKWVKDDKQTINVENRSNAPVHVSAKLDNTTENGASAALSTNATEGVDIVSAASPNAMNHALNKGPNLDFTVTVSGNPNISSDFTIGTVTVTFKAI